MNIGKWQILAWSWGWYWNKGYWPDRKNPIFKFWNIGLIEIRKFLEKQSGQKLKT